MSDTEQLFILAGIWSLISLFVAYFAPGKPAKVVVFLLLVGVPFWELPFGYINFASLCREETLVVVFKPIPPQQNVCVDHPFEDAAKEILKLGFASVEARGRSGDVYRFVSPSNTKLTEGKLPKLTVEYCFTSAMNIKMPWRMLRHDHLVRSAVDGEIVAQQSRFVWRGMWWQESASPNLGRGGFCSQGVGEIFKSVLVGASPKQK